MNKDDQNEFKVGDVAFYIDRDNNICTSRIIEITLTPMCGNKLIVFENGKSLLNEEVHRSKQNCVDIMKNFDLEIIEIQIAELKKDFLHFLEQKNKILEQIR